MDAFALLAEIALGVAGFGSVAIVLGQRRSDWETADAFRTSALFLTSLGALFLALLVVGLGAVGLAEGTVWRASSGAVLLYSVVAGRIMRRLRSRQLDPSLWLGAGLMVLVGGTAALSAAALLASVLGFWAGPGAAYLGIVWLLGFACLMLVRIVFYRPAEPAA